jgi:glycosyltransferase involved in cell wall biosynthesis
LIVSIVTPSYNQAQYLEFTIRSVLAQRQADQDDFEIEYLVVDGGSQDGSLEIIHKHESELVWWVSEPDAGQAEAINKGLRRARGEVVAWLNSDDLYLPGAVAEAAQAMQKRPHLGMVYGDALAIDQNGQVLNRWSFPNWGLEDFMRFRIICQPAVFMRRSILEDSGYLDPSYHYMLDHKLWLEMGRRAPIQHVGSLWAAARSHPGAKNVAHAHEFSQETLRLLGWIEDLPDFFELEAGSQRKIEGGAYRLSARYLLDGGLPGAALKDYARAFRNVPAYASKHWHRMLYALFYNLGARQLNHVFSAKRTRRRVKSIHLASLSSWPGLSIHE